MFESLQTNHINTFQLRTWSMIKFASLFEEKKKSRSIHCSASSMFQKDHKEAPGENRSLKSIGVSHMHKKSLEIKRCVLDKSTNRSKRPCVYRL
jgi:hypothetical protein